MDSGWAGTFNLQVERDPEVVRHEVERLLERYNLKFLCMQETTPYIKELRKIEGFSLYTGGSSNGGAQREIATLVRNDQRITNVRNKSFGNGWYGVHWKTNMPPRNILFVTLNNDLVVANVHYPPGVDLKNQSPKNRYDDYKAISKRIRRFLRVGRKRKIVCMDGNQPANLYAKYSPMWIAEKTNSKLSAPDNRIDYVLTKRAGIAKIKKLKAFREKSDHDVVIFKVF